MLALLLDVLSSAQLFSSFRLLLPRYLFLAALAGFIELVQLVSHCLRSFQGRSGSKLTVSV